MGRTGPRVPPPEVARVLRRLVVEVKRQEQIDQKIRELVERARSAGADWGEIGRSLGIKRQSARERFGP